MSIWQWHELLPTVPLEQRSSLGEGNTPLVASQRIGPEARLPRLFFKIESSNPSGSYKDRFAASAISHMRRLGQSMCIATSSGNTGAALAAYCAAASIACRIAVVETAPTGKLLQMQAYGADVFRVEGFGIDPAITNRTFDMLASLDGAEMALQISAFKYSPLGMAGVQTIAYEIARHAAAVDHVFVPAGGGGLTVAIAKGFQKLVDAGTLRASPKVHCVQPAGNDTIAGPLRRGSEQAESVDCTTAISGLQVPSVIDGNEAIALCRATGGSGFVVSDGDVYNAQRLLAQQEGIFCEPAGATALAGALLARANGEIHDDDSVICLVTGSGFKDLASIDRLTSSAKCPTIKSHDLQDFLAGRD